MFAGTKMELIQYGSTMPILCDEQFHFGACTYAVLTLNEGILGECSTLQLQVGRRIQEQKQCSSGCTGFLQKKTIHHLQRLRIATKSLRETMLVFD